MRCNNCGHEIPDDELRDETRTACPQCGFVPGTVHMAVAHLTVAAATLKTTATLLPPNDIGSMVLQAVVVPGDKTNEGLLIRAVTIPWLEIARILKESPNAMFEIPPRKWEEIIAGAYKQAGFEEVTLTPASGDHGRDVIAVKWGLGRVRVIDQVKAYGPNHLVTADDVRALIGVLHGDGASKGFLTTTSDFAPRLKDDPLITPLIPSRLGLVNGSELVIQLDELAKKGL